MNSTQNKPSKPDMATISKIYTYLGCANGKKIDYPEDAEWRVCKRNGSGSYEVICCDNLKIYYDIYSD